MSVTTIFLSLLFYTILGVIYCKGYDIVKQTSPERLPQFYMIMAAIRFVLIITIVGIYAFFSANKANTISFVTLFLILYIIMMIVTLKLKH